jgi:hypothetical protein
MDVKAPAIDETSYGSYHLPVWVIIEPDIEQ